MHQAEKMAWQFFQHEPLKEGHHEQKRITSIVKTAALVHDLGHGPFSHLFEDKFMKPKVPSWNHENACSMLLDAAVDENAIDIEKEDLSTIKEMITSKKSAKLPYCFSSIVSDWKYGVDADRLDYIHRDSTIIGIKSSVDVDRIIFGMQKTADGDVSHSIKNYDLLNQLFFQRHQLFRRVYHHPKVLALDRMMADVLDLSEGDLRITERTKEPYAYTHLTDDISTEIRIHPGLGEAKKILRRIDKRDFYRYLFTIPLSNYKMMEEIRSGEDSIKFLQDVTPDGVDPKEMFCELVSRDYGLKGGRNPMNDIQFYSPDATTSTENEPAVYKFDCYQNHFSMTVPQSTYESFVYVYCRKSDLTPQQRNEVFAKGQEWARKRGTRIIEIPFFSLVA